MTFRFLSGAAALLALPALAPAQTPARASAAQVSNLAGSCSDFTKMYNAKRPGQKSERVLITHPNNLVLDGRGNLYLSDPQGGISKMTLATRAVSHVTGTDKEGFAEGMPTLAQFNDPGAMVLDGKGTMFVADYGNQRIRKVELATGRVSTLAGSGVMGSVDGTGAQAQLHYPSSLVLDGKGNLYLSEIGSNNIRKIVLATGTVTTVAGSGKAGFADGVGKAARFNWPRDLALDAQGNLYVVDGSNHRIRKIVLATGTVSTLAGGVEGFADGTGASARFKNPRGLALDGKGNLYVADTGNNRIRRIGLSTGAVITVAGSGQDGFAEGSGAEATFTDLHDLVVDAEGTLYVTDDNCVRQVKP